jgi:hypothetical protein
LYDSFFTQNEEELFLVETNETSSNTIKWVLKEDIKTKMVDGFMNMRYERESCNTDKT